MRVFGCAWKINFLENIFSWPCVLMALTRKLVLVKIFTSNHFRTHAQRERERERERQKREPRSRHEPRAQITPWTQSLDHAFDFTDLRTNLWTHEPIFDPEPSTHEPSTLPVTQNLRATNPLTNLSLCVILIFCVILIDPRTDLRFCVILIFYFLSLIFDFFFFFLVVVVWVVVFWWFSCCVVVGFVWVVVENSIFRMLPNTWKYFLEQFL